MRKEAICPVCGKPGFFRIYVTEQKGKRRYRGMMYHRENEQMHHICEMTEEDYVNFNSGKVQEIWMKALKKWAMRQELLKKGIRNLREVRWVRSNVGNSDKVNAD